MKLVQKNISKDDTLFPCCNTDPSFTQAFCLDVGFGSCDRIRRPTSSPVTGWPSPKRSSRVTSARTGDHEATWQLQDFWDGRPLLPRSDLQELQVQMQKAGWGASADVDLSIASFLDGFLSSWWVYDFCIFLTNLQLVRLCLFCVQLKSQELQRCLIVTFVRHHRVKRFRIYRRLERDAHLLLTILLTSHVADVKDRDRLSLFGVAWFNVNRIFTGCPWNIACASLSIAIVQTTCFDAWTRLRELWILLLVSPPRWGTVGKRSCQDGDRTLEVRSYSDVDDAKGRGQVQLALVQLWWLSQVGF